MQTFRINKNALIICKSESRRGGFRHVASLMINGHEVQTCRQNYVNRTWESFTYATVINNLVEATNRLTDRQKSLFLTKINKY